MPLEFLAETGMVGLLGTNNASDFVFFAAGDAGVLAICGF
jgi:hypothetical protein